MRQAWHIFKKDVRGHLYEIAITLVVTAAFAFTGVREGMHSSGGESQSFPLSLVVLLLPLVWWNLIARVIHAEALPGDRQFWLTRPYNRRSLLAAKALFILIFVNVPMLLADLAIVAAYGFHVFALWPGFLWSQVVLTTVFILPIAALSAITPGLVQLLFSILLFMAFFLGWAMAIPPVSFEGSGLPLAWQATYCALIIVTCAALVILIWQYSRRRTAATRTIALATTMVIPVSLALIPWPAAFWIQQRSSQQRFDESAIRVSFDQERSWASDASSEGKEVRLNIPLKVTGIPSSTFAVPAGLTATIEAPNGPIWWAHQQPWSNVVSEGQLTSLRTKVSDVFYRRVRGGQVTLRGTLYLTLYGNLRSSRLATANQPVVVPGVGVCAASQPYGGRVSLLICDSAFRSPTGLLLKWTSLKTGISTDYTPTRGGSASPFPADIAINPISQMIDFSPVPASAVEVNAVEPLAYVRREFEIPNLRLADFEQH